MLKINGVELEFDLLDADTAEKYDECMKEIHKIKDKVVGMSVGESIRYQCNIIFDCFDAIFGEGTAFEVFNGKANLRICLEALESLVTEANKQVTDMDKKYSKYSPNRATRRGK